MTELTISEIWIYPIKSLGGIPLEKATVKAKGLQYDRRWMLIDGNGVAMTQRSFPQMAMLRPGIHDGKISVRHMKAQKDNAFVEFSMAIPPWEKSIDARVWDDSVRVFEVDREISEWFSHHLGTKCRLVAFPEENPRQVDSAYSVNQGHVSLADAYPFLIIGQRSLDELNTRLTIAVPMNRFRPNFVFAGGIPFMEDAWRDLSIGELSFVAVKKSDRCVLTTVDQETAQRGPEPLRTLSTYRKVGNKVYFGQNLMALSEGEVRVGDAVIPA